MSTLNPLQHQLDNFFAENSQRVSAVDDLFRKAQPILAALNDPFEPFVNQLQNNPFLERLVEALLTDNKALNVPVESLIAYWKLVAESIPQILPPLDVDIPQRTPKRGSRWHHWLKHISQSILEPHHRTTTTPLKTLQHLELQWQTQLMYSSAYITGQLINLKRGQTFHWFLPRKFQGEESLENIAVYTKNDDSTLDITLYHAEEHSSEKQGGESSLGMERAFSMRYYSHVPLGELFGPEFETTHLPNGIHVESVIKALFTPRSKHSPLIAAYKPLEAYMKRPESPHARLMQVEHTHPLKAIHAFFYDILVNTLSQKNPPTESQTIIDRYKAIICLSRVLLSSAYCKKLMEDGFSSEPLQYTRFGILSAAIASTARYSEKQLNNPFLAPLMNLITDTIHRISLKANELHHQTLTLSEECYHHSLPDQIDLIRKSLIACSGYLDYHVNRPSIAPLLHPSKASLSPILNPLSI